MFVLLSAAVFSAQALWAQENAEIKAEPLAEQDEKDQITLDAQAVRIVLNNEHLQGVDWEAIVSDFHSLLFQRDDSNTNSDKKYRMSVGSLTKEDYHVLTDALDTVGHMVQYPQPALDVPAKQKKILPVKFTDTPTSDEVNIDVIWTRQSGDNALMRLQPRISMTVKENNKMVTVSLKTRTDITIKDNTVIVLGGIISEEEMVRTRKFPLLGDLPIFNLVFRKQGRWMQRTETIIFLTPHFKQEQASPEENNDI